MLLLRNSATRALQLCSRSPTGPTAPGRSTPPGHARQRLATGLVAELEADVGEAAFLQLAAGQWPGLELHGHAVPAEPVQGLRVGRFLQQLARVAPELFIRHAQANQRHTQHYPQ
jgi:hypothetical protein